MSRKIAICTVIFLLVVSSFALAERPFYGSVSRVIDGDSLLIKSDSNKKNIEVRLYGVDCPEYNQPLSADAKKFVRKNLSGKKILVMPEYYDSYGRLVAIITYGDLVLNSKLVLSGLAWIYPQYCLKSVCKSWKKNEKIAMKMKRGIWREKEPIPPWKWKRIKHER